ncbi:hypothetical protein F53441_5443 [Fusarium austroafricanum]|uniref:DUF218 domain-containing protein n=1 Tax=Fusarium austroafricanum TaxID=2364996 RepID=A0A8H4KJQ1_9HYPO|nr:hypothetical protein F53441_5443 [Fusarium austroafricanum]
MHLTAMPPSHLIIVCCHGVWLGGPTHGQDEDEWLIADFQRGETPTFVQHIKAGVKAVAQERSNSVLIFSGGPTRKESRISEAAGYKNIAYKNNYWGLLQNEEASNAVLLEERALDSYHNVLFSLTLFHTQFKAWPTHITIVSHGFKKDRLVDGHCKAIGFPLGRVTFIGIDPPGMVAVWKDQDKEEAMKGVGLTMGEWKDDPHGRGESLAGKRTKRNPWAVWQGVFPSEDCDHGGLVVKMENGSEVIDEEAAWPW